MPTTKLNLPLIDGTNTADVVRDFNALANAVDNKAGVSDGLATLDASGKVPASQLNVSTPPDASTTLKGVVQLSNSTTSTSEVLAATPKAVKDAKDGLSAQIGILSGLNTTAKDNLVSAVNELFTFANDGKTNWSSVIGSPLVSSDTFTQMQTKTQTIKNTLATNLTNKGQSSAGTETLTALVNKVANVNTGKKYATGTAVFNSTNTVYQATGLSFSPNLVVVEDSIAFQRGYFVREGSVYTFMTGLQNNESNRNMTYSNGSTSQVVYEMTSTPSFQADGFTFYRTNAGTNANFTWYAFD